MPRGAVTSWQRGRWAESLALQHLQAQGLSLLEKNYHARRGEIDLIMQEDNTIVFLEVRYRADSRYMDALETIDAKKCARIIGASQRYLQSLPGPLHKTCRFDVVIIGGADKPGIRWIKNAFQA